MIDVDSAVVRFGAFCVVVYGVVSGYSTFFQGQQVVHEKNLASARNMASFNAMADGRKALNDPSRSTPWETRQADITKAIFANGKDGWDFVPMVGYRYDVAAVMKNANIAIVPHKEAGLPTTLVVDQSHGCLLVGADKNKDQAGDEARALLDEFKKNGAQGYQHLGTYILAGKEKVDFAPGQGVAVNHCPSPV